MVILPLVHVAQTSAMQCVQSVDTFLKITKTCKREFVVSQPEDDTPVPFVNIMLEEIGNIIELLQPEHVRIKPPPSSMCAGWGSCVEVEYLRCYVQCD